MDGLNGMADDRNGGGDHWHGGMTGDVMSSPPNDKGELLRGMLDLLWAGAQLDRLGDLHDLLDALVVLRPGTDDDRVVLAWWHVRARAWSDALRELRRTERYGELSSLGTALTAVCLYALKDPAWRTYAYAAAYQSDNALATRTALALLAAPEIEPFDGDVEEREEREVRVLPV